MKIYLAGPEVFFPDPLAEAERKKNYLAGLGHEGLFPLDNALDLDRIEEKPAKGLAIARANVELMESADAIIANLSPWHGPSADIGTVIELVYMGTRGKRVAAYSNDPESFLTRIRSHHRRYHGTDELREEGHPVARLVGPDGHTVEDFDLPDNLMLPYFLTLWDTELFGSFEKAAHSLR